MSVDDMLKGGFVLPKVIGWGAIAAAVMAIIGGVTAYSDLTHQVAAMDQRLRVMEAQAGPTQATLLMIQTSMARVETRLDILLQERSGSRPPAPPFP